MSKIERLAGIDAAFLYMETPTQHMHVCGTMILEPGGKAGGSGSLASLDAADRLAELMTRRISTLPAFRRTIVSTPLGISHPASVEAESFCAPDHVRRLTAPTPGGPEQLAELVGRIAAEPLDRRRPLWELWVIDGLDAGRIGLVFKIHHALVDGVAALAVLGHVFSDDDAVAAPPAHARSESPYPPNAWELALSMAGSVAEMPAKFASTMRHTGSALISLARSSVDLITTRARPAMPFSSPRTLLNHALTANRAVAFGQVSLATVKRIKNAFGVTVNDIVLAACTRALGCYLIEHGEAPQRPLVATVPVSEHGAAINAVSANQVSAMFLGLPVHFSDLDAVVSWIHEQSLGAKKVHAAFGPTMLAEWADLAPPNLFSAAVGAYSRWKLAEVVPPAHSIVISNVPGPTEALYAGDARLVAAYPLGPILEGAAVNISVVSYCGAIDIGLVTCPRAVPNPGEIARGFERAVEELAAAAARRAEPADIPRRRA